MTRYILWQTAEILTYLAAFVILPLMTSAL